jgi:NAD(P)-dependent dehydrogenase (short-subunit alcohol dehydrogenase family)
MNKTALITGASSGFGLLTSLTLARRGWRVLATMRDLNRREKLETAARDAGVLDRIEFHALDVTNREQIATIADIVAKRGEPLHALVNNAGFAVPGFAEDITDAELREQFDTNFFGSVALTRALLPQMRRQGFGHVVTVTSISGRVGFPGVSTYAASKFALEGWTETLRYEMKAVGDTQCKADRRSSRSGRGQCRARTGVAQSHRAKREGPRRPAGGCRRDCPRS